MSSLSKEEQKELVTRAQAGDQGAFSALYQDAHYKVSRQVGQRLFRVCQVNDPEAVKEIMQEAAVNAFLHLDRFQNDTARFSTWFCTIALNETNYWIDHNKRQCSGFLVRTPDLSSGFIEQIYGDQAVEGGAGLGDSFLNVSGISAERVAADREELAVLERFMEAARDDQDGACLAVGYDMTLMAVLEGKSYDEIAEIYDCPVGTVRSRMNRFRERAAEALQRPRTPAL